MTEGARFARLETLWHKAVEGDLLAGEVLQQEVSDMVNEPLTTTSALLAVYIARAMDDLETEAIGLQFLRNNDPKIYEKAILPANLEKLIPGILEIDKEKNRLEFYKEWADSNNEAVFLM